MAAQIASSGLDILVLQHVIVCVIVDELHLDLVEDLDAPCMIGPNLLNRHNLHATHIASRISRSTMISTRLLLLPSSLPEVSGSVNGSS